VHPGTIQIYTAGEVVMTATVKITAFAMWRRVVLLLGTNNTEERWYLPNDTMSHYHRNSNLATEPCYVTVHLDQQCVIYY
jgi:hypothetical protein